MQIQELDVKIQSIIEDPMRATTLLGPATRTSSLGERNQPGNWQAGNSVASVMPGVGQPSGSQSKVMTDHKGMTQTMVAKSTML